MHKIREKVVLQSGRNGLKEDFEIKSHRVICYDCLLLDQLQFVFEFVRGRGSKQHPLRSFELTETSLGK